MLISFRAFIYFILAIVCLIVCLIFLKKAKKVKYTTKCEECGNELKENERICNKCGNPIKDNEKQKSLYFIIVGVSGSATLFFGVKMLGIIFHIFRYYLN